MSVVAIGVDLGERRTGVARSAVGFAVPVCTLTKERKDSDRMRRLIRLAREHEATCFVVGLPLEMDGNMGTAAQAATEFARRLGERSGLPVHMFDERLSSVEAAEALQASGVRPRDRKAVLDQAAAVIILQGWLDREARG